MMPRCHDIEPQLSLLVDELLSVEAEADVRAHLSGCAACRGLLADLERLKSSARQLGPMVPPQHVWAEVAGEIRHDGPQEHETPRRTTTGTALQQWLGLAAALLLVTATIYFARGLSSPSSQSADNAMQGDIVEAADQVSDEVKLASAPAEKAISELEAALLRLAP